MAFGKTFHTLKEANAAAKKINLRAGYKPYAPGRPVSVRKLNKKWFPRTRKLFHVGGAIDFLNWG